MKYMPDASAFCLLYWQTIFAYVVHPNGNRNWHEYDSLTSCPQTSGNPAWRAIDANRRSPISYDASNPPRLQGREIEQIMNIMLGTPLEVKRKLAARARHKVVARSTNASRLVVANLATAAASATGPNARLDTRAGAEK